MLLLGNSYLSHTKSGCIQIFAKHFKCKYNLGITDVLNYTTVLKSIPESFKLIMVQWIFSSQVCRHKFHSYSYHGERAYICTGRRVYEM